MINAELSAMPRRYDIRRNVHLPTNDSQSERCRNRRCRRSARSRRYQCHNLNNRRRDHRRRFCRRDGSARVVMARTQLRVARSARSIGRQNLYRRSRRSCARTRRHVGASGATERVGGDHALWPRRRRHAGAGRQPSARVWGQGRRARPIRHDAGIRGTRAVLRAWCRIVSRALFGSLGTRSASIWRSVYARIPCVVAAEPADARRRRRDVRLARECARSIRWPHPR